MSVPGSFWLTLLQICVLAILVCLGSARIQPNTCPTLVSIPDNKVCPIDGSRHHTAREQLLKSLDRDTGKWNKKHPRWQVLEALHGYDKYEKIVGAEIDRFESLYKHIPQRHKKILESTIYYKNNFDQARQLLKTNAVFCSRVFQYALAYYNISRHELAAFVRDIDDGKAKPAIRTTISQTLKHMVRDWSQEGHAEREATFSYILSALTTHLPPPDGEEDTTYNVLVPGAGLGRLAHEIDLLAPYMSVTSNEWSTSMNIAYRYLSSSQAANQGSFTIHPFLETWSHARTRHELTRAVVIDPPTALIDTVLVEGDFTTKFVHEEGRYNAVVTLFFIDTARNLVAYLETIHSLLKPGGVWINVGPLLYGTAPQVQLSLDEIVAIAEAMGFEFEISEVKAGSVEESLAGKVEQREVLYNFNQSTLYKHGYVAQCWVAKKKGGEVGKGMFNRLKEKWL